MRPLLFCEPKVDSFLKGGIIVSQHGKNDEVLAVLHGPWKASGGGGLALKHEAARYCLLPFSAIHLVATSNLCKRSYAEFSPGGLHFVNWRRKWDGGEVSAHGRRRASGRPRRKLSCLDLLSSSRTLTRFKPFPIDECFPLIKHLFQQVPPVVVVFFQQVLPVVSI